MADTLNVALLQLESPGADPQRALQAGTEACRSAAAAGADIALFPEVWQLGYEVWSDDEAERTARFALAEDEDGPFVTHFAELAAELDMAIAITYLQRWPGAPRNASTLIDRHGRRVSTYAKVHTCDFGMDAYLTPGDGFPVTDLDTRIGTVRVGTMICYDREHPESARALMVGGAELILTPNACFLDDNRLGQFRTRAFENMLGVAMTNYARPGHLETDSREDFNGRSIAFSGIAQGEDKWPLDHLLVDAGPRAGIAMAHFDIEALRAYRRRGIWGDAYRKPGQYAALVGDQPVTDFARDVSRRQVGRVGLEPTTQGL
jgi:predicted amidohydrolase